MHRLDILIIDDDEDDFFIVKSLLEEISQGPLKLEWASSYQEGEALLSENKHAICLMDYRLGAKDGIELLKAAPSLGFSGPIIVLTGMHHTEIDMLALEAGAVDYLVKNGLTAEQLARSIRYAVGRKEMEIERIERLRAEAENRSKSEFLAHLSHELRTPLSAILGFTEILKNTQQSEESLSHINTVHRNGKHLLGLLNDILDLSKIEAGKLDLEMQTFQFIPFLADIYSLMYNAAMDKNLELHMSAQSSLPETIVSDPTRLRQVLLNLIGNAIKFTHQGTIDIYVDIVQKDEKNLIRFEVKDSGVGICLDNIQDIFKPFVQIKHSRVQTRTGTGLGLTISRQLVEHLGGDITVQSQEGVGSTFQFTIDPGELSEVPHRELSLRMNPESLPLQFPKQFQGRILVVDDLRDIRSLIGLYISRCGLQVEYANNGLEAINKITQSYETDNPFDLIFMDIHMPVKDGLTAAKEIRKAGYSCPLVALTAAHMQGDQERYILAGFNTSLSKPIDQSQMIGIIEQFLPAVGAGVKPHTPLPPQNRADLNPSQTHTEKLEVTAGEAKNILIVEDSQDALNAIANLLEILGWQPLTATCGQEALELAEDLKPDYALVDLNLPDFDGYYVSAQLQKLNPDISIYISSGAEVDYSKACNAVQGHLLKPISLAQLDQLFTSKIRH